MQLHRVARVLPTWMLTSVIGCGSSSSGPRDIAARWPAKMTIIAEGCTLDSGSAAVLASTTTRSLVTEVVLICLAAHQDGSLGTALASDVTTDPTTAVGETIGILHGFGYFVSAALTVGDETHLPYDAGATAALLNDSAWRSTVLGGWLAMSADADALDLALPTVDNGARDSVTAFVYEIAAMAHPAKKVGVFLPPSSTIPSDLPGGDVFDLASLAPSADRLRLMTLDYSCCGAPPGPTTDAFWAVDVQRLAATQVPSSKLELSAPLYGYDFSTSSATPVTFGEAHALAAARRAELLRTPAATPHFRYSADDGTPHEVWFDDKASTLAMLSSWSRTTDRNVGVAFYGLGAEDPSIWPALAARSF
jgi:hypothetical protein